METQLISTKFSFPPSRFNLVQRERLAVAERMKLTVVSAPPGFGETTLLTEWATTTELPLTWLSLNEKDND